MDPRRAGALIGPVEAPAIQVMSWNIRRRMPNLLARPADRWEQRVPRIRALLRAEQPTLLGAQEALPDQVSCVRDCLGEAYQSLGRGRGADGRGETAPIFYDTRRLELLDWEQLSLSERPAKPGSVSWGNVIPRIMVVATFRDRRTSRRFLTVNTHLDHLARRSRLRSAQMIRRVIVDRELPAVITGDLNVGAGSAPLRTLLSGGELTDVWETAQTRGSEAWGTFPNYRMPRRGGRRLDWILASPEFGVPHAVINARRYGGGWPSDHLPVQAVLLPPENSDTA